MNKTSSNVNELIEFLRSDKSCNINISPLVGVNSWAMFLVDLKIVARDDNFFWWDKIFWDEIRTYFCPIKKFRDGSEIFFISLVNTGREWDWQILFYLISLPTKNENFFNWDGILRDPISFGTRSGHIFVLKKYIGMRVGRFFFHLHIQNEIEIGKSHLIMSHCQP